MAFNLFSGIPATVVAKQTISFEDAGLDNSNVHIVYEIGNPIKSWVPDRAINSVLTFTEDRGYYIVPKIDLDLTSILAPPLVTLDGALLVTANYCNLAGATSLERSYLNDFTAGMVEDGLYNLFPFIAPLVGNSANNKRYNLKDPGINPNRFTIQFTGTPLNHAKGLQWQSNQGGTLQLQTNLLSGVPLIGGGCYSQDTNLRYAFISVGNSDFNVGFNDGGKTYLGIGNSSAGVTATATTGLLYGQREDANTVKSYKDTTERTSETLGINNFSSTSLILDGLNNPVMSGYFINNAPLDATQRTNFTNHYTNLMTGLGRNVT